MKQTINKKIQELEEQIKNIPLTKKHKIKTLKNKIMKLREERTKKYLK